jgi:Pycsar effector protein
LSVSGGAGACNLITASVAACTYISGYGMDWSAYPTAITPERTATPLPTAGLEYARRMYDRVIDWYKVAESKAQLILTVNGVFVSVAFGVSAGASSADRSANAGPETWAFLGIGALARCASITCAAICLQSRHQFNRKTDFAQLRVDPDDRSTYRPEALWYFGHIAELPRDEVVARLRTADEDFELAALTYNVHGLAVVVLRKHRFINAGWALTALGLIALATAATSFVVRSAV